MTLTATNTLNIYVTLTTSSTPPTSNPTVTYYTNSALTSNSVVTTFVFPSNTKTGTLILNMNTAGYTFKSGSATSTPVVSPHKAVTITTKPYTTKNGTATVLKTVFTFNSATQENATFTWKYTDSSGNTHSVTDPQVTNTGSVGQTIIPD